MIIHTQIIQQINRQIQIIQWIYTNIRLDKKKATKREILSLVGLLQHAAKVIQCGRSFVNGMYATAAKFKELEYFTPLNSDFCSDLSW